ncbi:MAG: TolC family protein, partial [Thermodesulfobacteriota bacterium]|nr:TolC family protein [Thermodesulfobacteriota bacterium]
KTELAIFKEVKTAFLSFTDASKRFEVAKTATAQAEESFALARERYQGGSVPITRYLETELAKKQAEINLVAARYDKKIAQGEIARALGILSTIWEKE